MRVCGGVELIAWLLLLAAPGSATNALAEEAKWESQFTAIDIGRNAVAGTWSKTGDALHVDAARGARLTLPITAQGDYDFRVAFTRVSGEHSIALIFTHGEGQATFEVDAWGEHLAGIQNVSDRSIRENATRQANQPLENGRRYTLTVEVRKGQVRGLLDDRVVVTHRTDGSDLSMPSLWALPNRRSLGLGAWDSETIFHSVEVRQLNGVSSSIAKNDGPPATTPVAKTPPTKTPAAKAPASKTPPRSIPKTAGQKRVLMVIANYHFFYREYAEPRSELERAGLEVTVAAGVKGPCRPHVNSGQPAGSERVVQSDLALADVKAGDYDAILFSGGWGASAYQYAFDGRYNDPIYNGNPATKAAVNRLINEFVAQGKYVCALCNAVSVLAWARIGNQSPLRGKRVCAPTRAAAPGIYNGQPAQPSCRWHPEMNGAVLSPPGSIGQAGTAEDDVLVDGKIVTAEDDISAREMGRRLVQLLSSK